MVNAVEVFGKVGFTLERGDEVLPGGGDSNWDTRSVTNLPRQSLRTEVAVRPGLVELLLVLLA